jgi:hypothetical protein
VTLQETLECVHADVLHFIFTMRGWNEAADVEIEIARRDDESNPAYAALLLPSRLAYIDSGEMKPKPMPIHKS